MWMAPVRLLLVTTAVLSLTAAGGGADESDWLQLTDDRGGGRRLTTTADGCGLAPPSGALPGSTVELTLPFGGVERPYHLHLPSRYNPSVPTPVVLMFHGYAGNGGEMASVLSAEADVSTFIVVAPTGAAENESPSWNGGGSSDSPGPQGPTCVPGSEGACYDSCAARPQGCDECDWTTCLDDVAFVSAL